MTKRTDKIDRRKKWPPQVLLLTIIVSTTQFFGMWSVFLTMDPEINEFRWIPLLLQFLFNLCFTFLLISMSFRAFHLSRMVNSARQALEEEKEERKFREAHLRFSKEQSEAASKAKTEYMANLSHEFRTPMNAVVGFSELLLNESLTEEQRDYTETIYANSKHLLGLLNNVLDLSKIESGEFEIVPESLLLDTFIEGIGQIIRPSIEAKGLRFEIDIEDNLPEEIVASEIHLRQCVINLIGNAIKFTESGVITLRLRSKSNDVFFEVIDSGIGISKNQLEKIFQPFMQADKTTTRNYGGTGLGLAITQKLIELMGGKITVQSLEGHGSTFTLVLPCNDLIMTKAS